MDNEKNLNTFFDITEDDPHYEQVCLPDIMGRNFNVCYYRPCFA